MRSRRLFALLTSVSMLHLTLASSDSACATHGAGDHHAPTAQGIATQHAMPMHGRSMPSAHEAGASADAAVPVATSDTTPCEIPTQQNCCEALVGCSVAGGIASARQLLTGTTLPTMRVRTAQHDAPASFASAPEPPPPKA